jgi:hypothetical protein
MKKRYPILPFIIVGVFLAVLFIGSLYIMKRLASSPASPPRSTVTLQKTSNNNQKKHQASNTDATSVGDSQVLPQTGASSIVGPIFIILTIVFLSVTYIQSRRLPVSL